METGQIIELVVDYGVRIVGALLALWVAWKLAGVAERATEQQVRKSGRVDETLARFSGKAVGTFVKLLGALAILGLLGIQTASFVAVLGAAGLAVGLAFQGTLANFAAGIMLLVFRPFKVGEAISVAGVTGGVAEIGIFTTTLDTRNCKVIILPNSSIFGSTIERLSPDGPRRVDIPVGVDYSADLDGTRKALDAAAATISGILPEPAPAAVLTGLGDSSVNWEVRVYCEPRDYWGVLEAGTEVVKRALDDADIGIPYPTVDLNVVSGSVN